MTAFLVFIGIWSLVALAISLLLGSALGRRRPAIDSLGSSAGKRAEGERPGGEASGTPSAAPRRDVPNRWRMVLELVAIEPCRVEKKGSACRLLDGPETPAPLSDEGIAADLTARDLWWCPPCLARDALNPQTPSSPVTPPGFEAASPAAVSSPDTAGDASKNVP